jgi:hypothetical protein
MEIPRLEVREMRGSLATGKTAAPGPVEGTQRVAQRIFQGQEAASSGLGRRVCGRGGLSALEQKIDRLFRLKIGMTPDQVEGEIEELAVEIEGITPQNAREQKVLLNLKKKVERVKAELQFPLLVDLEEFQRSMREVEP